ncbi:MAG: GAF domain-containing protein [Asticcacaulis sp.]
MTSDPDIIAHVAPSPPVCRRHEPPSSGVVQALSQARDIDAIGAIVRTAARELTGADGATFVLRDGDKCHYADEDAIEPLWKGRRFPLEMCISGWVMLNAKPVMIEDIYLDERIPAEAYRPTFVKSLAMVPVRRQAPIAAIGNYWASNRRASDEEMASCRPWPTPRLWPWKTPGFMAPWSTRWRFCKASRRASRPSTNRLRYSPAPWPTT